MPNTIIAESLLIERIVSDFLPHFAPDGILRYVVGEDWAHRNPERIADLGLTTKSRRRMPDVLIHQQERKRLILIDASTSQGVMTIARRDELSRMYFHPNADLVFVTAFPSLEAMTNYFEELAWETAAWVADAPDHLVRFNGDKFLGPYSTKSEGDTSNQETK